MKAEELRIGNLIELPCFGGEGKVIISDISYDIFSVDATALKDAERNGNDWAAKPIPLTEEWLLKFGFVNGEKNNFSFTKHVDLRIFGHESDYNGLWIGKIEHVHQLQNIYFALTGEELTIKD